VRTRKLDAAPADVSRRLDCPLVQSPASPKARFLGSVSVLCLLLAAFGF
jgi:hypothetical protein